MSLHVIDGLMGSGKSYYIVNHLLADIVERTTRPIVVTKNLEIQWEEYLEWLVPRKMRKTAQTRLDWIAATRKRFIILENKSKQAFDQANDRPLIWNPQDPESICSASDEDWAQFGPDNNGNSESVGLRPDLIQSGWIPFQPNDMTEFWYFTPPNSFIVYDEAADNLNSRKWQALATTKLQSYINHSRHFKDDLYFLAQDYSDLDKQLREKFMYLHNVRNSLKEPIVGDDTKGLFKFCFGGMTYPMQFFIIDTMQRSGRKLKVFATQKVFPKSRGFKNYKSFSAPTSIAGKVVDDNDELVSEDIGQTFWQRSKIWLARLPSILMFFCMLGAAILFIWAAVSGFFGDTLRKMLVPTVSSTAVDEVNETLTKTENAESKSEGTQSEGQPVLPENGEAEEIPGGDEVKEESEPEKILLVTPRVVVTDKDTYSFTELPPHIRESVAKYMSGWRARSSTRK